MHDFRTELLRAVSEGTSKFSEVSLLYKSDLSYFKDMAANVKAELVAAFLQGLRTPKHITLYSARPGAPWKVIESVGNEAIRNLKGCIVHDKASHECFWITGCEKKKLDGIPMGLQETESQKNDELIFNLEALDIDGQRTLNSKERNIQVVLFASDYAARFGAAKAGASQKLKKVNDDLLRMVLKPGSQYQGSFEPIRSAPAWLNVSQRKAVCGLERRLEVIHGPPGTGKSTTILGLLQTRVPPDRTAIVTCVTNQAVDAVCHKLEPECEDIPFIVVGNWDNLGTIARRFLLEEQLKRNEEVLELRQRINVLQAAIHEAEDQYSKSVTRASKATWKGNLEALKERRPTLQKKFDETWCIAERELVQTARCFLCTIASLYRVSALREQYEEEGFAEPHTAVLDEAGATPETYVPQVLHTGVENLVLLGDHKQLPPLVLTMNPAEIEEKNVKRSLMERALDQMPENWIHSLKQQYRMHPSICSLVSSMFYKGLVKTGGRNADWAEPKLPSGLCVAPIRWLPIKQPEVTIGTSKVNLAEAAAIVAWLEWEAPRAWELYQNVKCITFYKQQRDLIRACLAEELAECVVSVDASQGSEAEHIIVSTVRSNGIGDVGFCADPRRLCVALSRAKLTLSIVGDRDCMNRGIWKEVLQVAQMCADNSSTGCYDEDSTVMLRVDREFQRMRQAKEKPCRFFIEGRCTKAECPFIHDSSPAKEVLENLRKVADPCVFYAQGRCTKGKDCTFSHDFKPGDEDVMVKLKSSGALKEVEPCKFFLQGKCTNGRNCTFSHAMGVGNKKAAAELRSKAEPCRFYAAGKCTNGANCTFSHDFKKGDKTITVQLSKTAEKCKFYDLGKCTNGTSCTFSHDFIPSVKSSSNAGYPAARGNKRR